MIDLALLGCGGGVPIPNRFLSATLMNYQGRKILIDCGEGTQVSMKLLGWGFKTIDVICITHGHGDHTVGLPGLLATIGNSGRTDPLIIIGPEGIRDIVNGLRVVAPFLPYEINIIENPKKVNLKVNKNGIYLIENHGELEINTLELDHSTKCLGYSFYIKRNAKFNIEKAKHNNVPKNLWNVLQKGIQIEVDNTIYYPEMVLGDERKGIKISYITDSRPLDTMISFINNSNLFICEGTYGDDKDIEKAIKNKHMTFREAGTLARNGDVDEIILTHFSPAMVNPNEYKKNVEEIFEKVILGHDRLMKTLSFKEE